MTARVIPQVEAIKLAYAALSDDFAAWVEARDHAQAQVDRIQNERARLLRAEGECLKAELADARGERGK